MTTLFGCLMCHNRSADVPSLSFLCRINAMNAITQASLGGCIWAFALDANSLSFCSFSANRAELLLTHNKHRSWLFYSLDTVRALLLSMKKLQLPAEYTFSQLHQQLQCAHQCGLHYPSVLVSASISEFNRCLPLPNEACFTVCLSFSSRWSESSLSFSIAMAGAVVSAAISTRFALRFTRFGIFCRSISYSLFLLYLKLISLTC